MTKKQGVLVSIALFLILSLLFFIVFRSLIGRSQPDEKGETA
jgi:hypothetical protein